MGNVCGRRSRGFSLLIFLLFLSAKGNGFAQNPSLALSLPQCIELARAAPSTVKRAQEQLIGATYRKRAAAASFLPQVSIANNFTYNSPLLYDDNAFSFIALNGVREYSSVANASLEVDTSGRLRALYNGAQADQLAAQVGVVLSERDLERAVSVAYYRALLTRKLAASAEENVHAAGDFEKKVQQLVSGGEASRADLTKASLETALLEHTAASMEIEAAKASHDLASYWTTDVAAPLTLADDLDRPPVAPLLQSSDNAYLKRPEFRLFAAQIAGFKANAREARSYMLPHLSVNFEYGIDATHVTSRDRGYAGFVHFDIPVFDFLHARGEQRAFQSQALAAATNQNIETRVFSKEYQDALTEVQGDYAQIGITQRQVDLANDNLRLSRLRFEGGEGSALDVVTAQSSLVQAEIDFYTTRANYLNAQSALKVASGQ